jgi:energy-coupling factor transporter ATP-binding protein EcfA2
MPSPPQLVQLYRDFDPAEPVSQATLGQFVERRGESAQTIFEDLQLGLDPLGKWVITGSVGCGKSSELVKLADLLREDYAVVPLDLPNSVARVDMLQPAEILFLAGAATVKAARDLWGHEIETASQDRLIKAFAGLVPDRDLDLNSVFEGVALFLGDLVVPGAGKIAAAATKTAGLARRSHRPSALGGKTRPVSDGSADLQRLLEALDLILQEVRSAYRAPVILVDGLDKLFDLDKIRNLFVTTRTLCEPACVIVYTGPITLMLAPEWKTTGDHFRRIRLSNLVVRPPRVDGVEIPAARIEDDRERLRDLVRLRVATGGFEIADVCDDESLELLIDLSGGLVRDLVHLVNRAIRNALKRDGTRISLEDVQAARDELRKDMDVSLNTMLRDELAHVEQLGEPSGKPDAHRLLLWGYVLPYTNGRVWFESHPLLSD